MVHSGGIRANKPPHYRREAQARTIMGIAHTPGWEASAFGTPALIRRWAEELLAERFDFESWRLFVEARQGVWRLNQAEALLSAAMQRKNKDEFNGTKGSLSKAIVSVSSSGFA
jgi:hypothetical protein